MARERRRNFRVEWHSPATLYDCDNCLPRSCIVSNFSNGGAKISGVRPATIPDELMLSLSPRSRARKCRVVWRSDDAVGVEFCDVVATAHGSKIVPKVRKKVPA